MPNTVQVQYVNAKGNRTQKLLKIESPHLRKVNPPANSTESGHADSTKELPPKRLCLGEMTNEQVIKKYSEVMKQETEKAQVDPHDVNDIEKELKFFNEQFNCERAVGEHLGNCFILQHIGNDAWYSINGNHVRNVVTPATETLSKFVCPSTSSSTKSPLPTNVVPLNVVPVTTPAIFTLSKFV